MVEQGFGMRLCRSTREERGSAAAPACIWIRFRNRLGQWPEHGAQIIAIDQSNVTLFGRGFDRRAGEFAACDQDGARGAFVDHHAHQLMHRVVRHLHGVPVLALDEDVFIALAQL